MIKSIKSILTKDEAILQDCRVHWIVFCRPVIYAVIGVFVAVFFHPLVGALILLMDLFALYAAVVFYQSTHLVLTAKKNNRSHRIFIPGLVTIKARAY